MKQALEQIYLDLSRGILNKAQALEQIRKLKRTQADHPSGESGTLLCVPGWEELAPGGSDGVGFDRHHVLLCGFEPDLASAVADRLGDSECRTLVSGRQGNIPEFYRQVGRAGLAELQRLLSRHPEHPELVQLVISQDGDRELLAGLSGLLNTASLENPLLGSQVVLIEPDVPVSELADRLRECRGQAQHRLVRCREAGVQARSWQIQSLSPDAPVPYKDQGVYLITGGLGGLGLIFARDILDHTARSRVILTGRSELTGSQQSALSALCEQPGRVEYHRVDVVDPAAVQQLLDSVQDRHGPLNGIIHSAGVIQDNYILNKTAGELDEVFAPKVDGTLCLDRASAGISLDFFALCSSIASPIGNPGQGDYAAANGFMDQFAAYRNRQVRAGQRHGHSVAINWPLWSEGGMQIDPEGLKQLERQSGIRPMATAIGLKALHHSLCSPDSQVCVMHGDTGVMREVLQRGRTQPSSPDRKGDGGVEIDASQLGAATRDYLRRQFSGLLKLSADKIDPEAPLEKYGIDSILAMKLTGELEKSFGVLPKTLFFEYQSLSELADYLIRSHSDQLGRVLQPEAVTESAAAIAPVEQKPAQRRFRAMRSSPPKRSGATAHEAVAIIGLSGRYPESPDIQAYWQNLKQGKDCITEVPASRWNWRDFYSEDRTQSGRHYSKWGGFIEGVDEFDPRFFNISPREAETIDPQERLFLQHAWMAMEDAGYTRAGLQAVGDDAQPGQVGVYAGVMYGEYNRSGSLASIANRVSYVLNLHGPSLTLDTMCSSSLTAIHLACQDLKQGRTGLGIAGGVNVSIHPNKYLMLSTGQFISSDGHCQSFGEGGDGYIPGEGVGVVVLKRLSDAEADGDHIYGIIRGSAVNHGGKTNGYTVPNPRAQAGAVRSALDESGVDARAISYVEAHGTGTKLGDPIEITALSQAFGVEPGPDPSCYIGSAKSNIGHCESAAGIAGLTKVLLQLEHRQLVPSLHSERLNPHIDFAATPFEVNQTLRDWDRRALDGVEQPRLAGVSSFGAGGANAHVVVSEYAGATDPLPVDRDQVVLLSARTADQLRAKATDLLTYLEATEIIDLVGMAYTLQVGREALDERLGLLVRDRDGLRAALEAYLSGDPSKVWLGRATDDRESSCTEDDKATWLEAGAYRKLLEAWVTGEEVDWRRLYGNRLPTRVSLPVYPFAKERYWDKNKNFSQPDTPPDSPVIQSTERIHPLLHINTSDFSQQRYSSTFKGDEEFLNSHPFATNGQSGQRILPALMQMEMVRAAVEAAFPKRPESSVLVLEQVVWGEFAVIGSEQTLHVCLFDQHQDGAAFEIYFADEDREILYCQGYAVFQPKPSLEKIDALAIRREISNSVDGNRQRQQLIESLSADAGEAGYTLSPEVSNRILKAANQLIGGKADASACPVRLDSLRFGAEHAGDSSIWIRHSSDARPEEGPFSLDVDVCDKNGQPYAQLSGLHCWPVAAGSGTVDGAVSENRASEIIPNIDSPTEIPLRFEQRTPSAPGNLDKPDDIKLTEPEEFNKDLPGSPGKPDAVELSGLYAIDSAGPPAVRLYDHGHGILTIRMSYQNDNVLSGELISQLVSAVDSIEADAAVRVLMLRGTPSTFLTGDSQSYNNAVDSGLLSRLGRFPYPVIAMMEGDASGAGFVVGAIADFMICAEQSRYGLNGVCDSIYPEPEVQRLMEDRFGSVLSHDLFVQPGTVTGQWMIGQGWQFPILPQADIEAYAYQLAAELAGKSRTALRLLKNHLARKVTEQVDSLRPQIPPAPAGEQTGTRLRPPGESAIRLRESENRVLVVEIDGAEQPLDLKKLAADLGQLFSSIRSTKACKSVVLRGEYFFQHLDQQADGNTLSALCRLMLESPVPVIAALECGLAGQSWLFSLHCDGVVYNSSENYSATGVLAGDQSASRAAVLFPHRLGHGFGREILLSGASYSGGELARRARTSITTEREQIIPEAVEIAAFWADWPVRKLASWKQASALSVRRKMEAQPRWRAGKQRANAASGQPEGDVELNSHVVTATQRPNGVVLVRMEDRESANMFSKALVDGLTEAFDHVSRTPSCKVVLLTGFDNYFATGGTRETLLDIQAGKAQFTDNKIYQLALDCEIPVIAAMQGHAIGAGWALGMFADLTLFSKESRYLSPYMSFGFTPGAGSTLAFPSAIGLDLARETLFTAVEKSGSALESRNLGLPVLPRAQVVESALKLADRVSETPRSVLIALKHQWAEPVRESLEQIYRQELEMHEATFVGQSDTRKQIQAGFNQESEGQPRPPAQAAEAPGPAATGTGDSAGAVAEVTAALRSLLAGELYLDESEIDPDMQFIDLGLDSITGVTWVRKINEKYQIAIEATKVYNFPTLAQLSQHVKEQAEQAGSLTVAMETIEQSTEPDGGPDISDKPASHRSDADTGFANWAVEPLVSWRKSSPAGPGAKPASPSSSGPIAVIGMDGQFPASENLSRFWENLAQGRNCISEVPGERWDSDFYFSPGAIVAGKSNSKWMGCLDGYNLFDASFFNISPREAKSMDPQQRLFLQACWNCIESAGYAAQSLSGSRTGVYVGCTHGDYHRLSPEAQLNSHVFTGDATSILAARISYLLNLTGPCLSLDTACSSSLVAIANACDSLLLGACDLAMAGGVYVATGPELHIKSAQAGMLSLDGRCYTFDQRANGFVPGEGVGVVLLKRLSDAERDNDPVLGVIEGWGVNQDGKTNGITAPNPESQTRLQMDVYKRHGIDPSGIQLVEAHGTGTPLGDPIEIEGLSASFANYTDDEQFCALGSVKSNIGHCLTAAGIAGFLKLMLAIRNRQIPPTINFNQLNEHIKLDNTPFYVNHKLKPWEVGHSQTRRAAISSFGFSGTNAHLVVAEHAGFAQHTRQAVQNPGDSENIFVLSAKNEDRLKQRALDLLSFLERGEPGREPRPDRTDLPSIAFTLQTGRDAMNARLAIVAGSRAELAGELEQFIEGKSSSEHRFQGNARDARQSLNLLLQEKEVKDALVSQWTTQRNLAKLGKLWVQGLNLDWNLLYSEQKPRRIGLPTYPFTKNSYWINYRPVAAESVRQHDAPAREVSQLLFYKEQWRALPSDLGAEPERARRQIIFCDPPFAEAIEQGDSSDYFRESVVVHPSDRYQLLSAQSGTCRFGESADILRCLKDVGAGADVPVTIVFMWSMGKGRDGVDALFSLFNAIKESDCEISDVTLVGRYDPAERESCWDYSWIGFERSLRHALPKTRVSILYTDASSLTPEQLAEGVGFGGVLWFRGEEKLALSFESTELAKLEQQYPVRQGGCYLITGGAGALGFSFARYLAGNYKADLILVGRSPSSEKIEQQLEELELAGAAGARYQSVDVSDRQAMEKWAAQLPIKPAGIIHAAGVDVPVPFHQKSPADIDEVLGPKTDGTIVLDEVFAGQDLDFVCYFSSSSAQLGDFGSCDYSIANRFQMAYAAHRNQRNALHGRALVINWPFWQDGGMGRTDEAETARYLKMSELEFGLRPLETSEGIETWLNLLNSGVCQTLVMVGKPGASDRFLRKIYREQPDRAGNSGAEQQVSGSPRGNAGVACSFEAPRAINPDDALSHVERPESGTLTAASHVDPRPVVQPAAELPVGSLLEQLKVSLADLLEMPRSEVHVDQSFGDLGLDSMVGLEWVSQLNQRYGTELPNFVVYDYPNIRKLAHFLEKELATSPATVEPVQPQETSESLPVVEQPDTPTDAGRPGRVKQGNQRPVDNDRIAIVGMAGRYPDADNLEQYWSNLLEGKNSIIEIPESRWNARLYYDDDGTGNGRVHSKWLGMMQDVDCFDPLFFRISPQEAVTMDPQQRLFLQEAYRAFEDAGYRAPELNNSKCGVYLGISTSEYGLLLSQNNVSSVPATSNSYAIAASRIAYHLDLKGPAISVDTSCSSSLVAIHLACQALKTDEISMALAGGVNLWLSPEPFFHMTHAGMLSPVGQCKTFDESADGIVVGEGVGAVVLKRLRDAVADGDCIHGVILGSGTNQDGRTNGITAPSMKSQVELEREVYRKYSIDPATIDYVETHGTGTKLGDPIELQALHAAFSEKTDRKNYCALASVKSNIGHTAAAAGVASVHKVLLSIRHKTIPRTLNVSAESSHFDFRNSPFFVNQSNRKWQSEPSRSRRAAVSSFGFSGTNAHMVIEEFKPGDHGDSKGEQTVHDGRSEVVVPLSAKNQTQLGQKARDLSRFLASSEAPPDLLRVAYTLQTGREAMDERLCLVAASVGALREALEAYTSGRTLPDGAYQGLAETEETSGKSSTAVDSGPKIDPHDLAAYWCRGGDVDWRRLYNDDPPRKISLPVYPFAKDRYWFEPSADSSSIRADGSALHPLVHQNVSDLQQQRYRSTFNGQEPLVSDYRVNGQPELPPGAALEAALAAVWLAQPEGREDATIGLENVLWLNTIPVHTPQSLEIALNARDKNSPRTGWVDFEISRPGTSPESTVICCQGRGGVFAHKELSRLKPEGLKHRMTGKTVPETGFYQKGHGTEKEYGSSYRNVEFLYQGEHEVLLELADGLTQGAQNGPPSLPLALMDTVFQAAAYLLPASAARRVIAVAPYALDSIKLSIPLVGKLYAWIRLSGNDSDLENADDWSELRMDVDFLEEDGSVRAQIRGLACEIQRQDLGWLGRRSGKGWLAFSEQWVSAPVDERTIGWSERVDKKKDQTILVIGDSSEISDAVQQFCVQLSDVCGKEGEPWEVLYHPIALGPAPDQSSLAESLKATNGALTVFMVAPGNADGAEQRLKIVYETVQTLLREVQDRPVVFHYHYHRPSAEGSCYLDALSGLFKSAMLESMTHHYCCISHDHDLSNLSALAQTMVREWLCEETSQVSARQVPMLRFEGDKRFALRAEEAGKLEACGQSSGFKHGGTYLLVGALGAVGEAICREIGQRYQARLILISRRSEQEVKNRLRSIEDSGASVVYRSIDTLDRAALSKQIQGLTEQGMVINGVIHMARQVEDAPMVDKPFEAFRRNMAVKAEGTLIVDSVTAEHPLDFFMVYSSVAALGIKGSVDYAYSTAFQNAFVRYRNGLRDQGSRSGRAVAICWGQWDADGAVSADKLPARLELLQQAGMDCIDPHSAADWMQLCLFQQADVIGVIAAHDQAKVRQMMGFPELQPTKARELEARINEFETGEMAKQEFAAFLDSLNEEHYTQALLDRIIKTIRQHERKQDHRFTNAAKPTSGPSTPTPGSFRKPADAARSTPKSDTAATNSETASETTQAASQRILANIKTVLGLKSVSVEGSRSFQDYGLDSITAAQLSAALEKEFGFPIPPNWLVEFPTLDALTEKLEKEHKKAGLVS